VQIASSAETQPAATQRAADEYWPPEEVIDFGDSLGPPSAMVPSVGLPDGVAGRHRGPVQPTQRLRAVVVAVALALVLLAVVLVCP